MANHKYRYFLGLCLLLFLFFLPLNSPYYIHESVAGTPSNDKFEKYFHFKGSQEFDLKAINVVNEAIIQINCHLFANSTSNITLIIKPEPEWNVSHIAVEIGQNITVTVSNGVVITPPSYVPALFDLWIHLGPEMAEVWGKIIIVITTWGWEPAVPGFLFPGFLSLLLFVVIRSWKTRKKNKLL